MTNNDKRGLATEHLFAIDKELSEHSHESLVEFESKFHNCLYSGGKTFPLVRMNKEVTAVGDIERNQLQGSLWDVISPQVGEMMDTYVLKFLKLGGTNNENVVGLPYCTFCYIKAEENGGAAGCVFNLVSGDDNLLKLWNRIQKYRHISLK